MIQRIYILGAAGSGTTTLGRALAESLNTTHLDTDTYFWKPTDPPFTQQRERAKRQQLLMDGLTAHDSWVLSGSLCGWGDVAIPLFELVVFLLMPYDLRIERLRQREIERYGKRIMPGGDMYEQSQEFLAWAHFYDTGDEIIRSRRLHEQWLSMLSCPIVCIEGKYTIEEQIDMRVTEIEP